MAPAASVRQRQGQPHTDGHAQLPAGDKPTKQRILPQADDEAGAALNHQDARSLLPAKAKAAVQVEAVSAADGAPQAAGRAVKDAAHAVDGETASLATDAAPAPTTPEKDEIILKEAAASPATGSLEDPLQDPEVVALADNSPFLDLTSPMTPYEWFKLVVCLPLVLVKAVLTLIGCIITWAFVRALTFGVKLNEPMPRWRSTALRAWVRFWAGLFLRAGLNFWPKVVGRENIAKGEAVRALIVFNHVSYVDGIVVGSIFAPCGVAKASVAQIPFFGVFTRALQFLFVARRGTADRSCCYTSRGNTTQLVAKRAADARYPLLMIAPEATTKHANCLLKFSTGAFVSGAPVLPVLLKYRAKYFNCGWGITYTPFHLLRLLTQFVNHLEVEVLPPYMPSEAEKLDPSLYAENVRRQMAGRLGAALSEHGIPQQQGLKRRGIYVDWTGWQVLVKTPTGPKVVPATAPINPTHGPQVRKAA